MSALSDSPSNTGAPAHTRLRLLATTDLHSHLLAYDYIKDQPTQGGGLAGLARLISEARAQAQAAQVPVLLLDNGDTFQGTPLADHLAARAVDADHPIVACFNRLHYDALGLGNHDLDHGLPYLKAVATALDMPMLSSNLREVNLSPVRAQALLSVPLPPGAPAPLTVGLLSVLPAQSAAWHQHHLGTGTKMTEPEDAVGSAVSHLRASGADLVVVLAHMGVGHRDGATTDTQAAHLLVHSGRIDALVLGHTHRRLPSVDYAHRPGVDVATSTIGGVPAIMAGHAGSDLGVMDLELHHTPDQGWQIARHRCVLRPNGANVKPDPVIEALAMPVHHSVVRELAEPVATTDKALHSYFSVVSPSLTQHLTAHAQYRLVRSALARTEYADLPVLSAAAAHLAGGRDGPGNYIHVPAGPVLRRHISGLNPFANQTLGIRIDGAGLQRWLEHAVVLFHTQRHDAPHQRLVNPDVPTFQFDTIFGLEYRIDVTAPPFSRISQMRFEGVAVRPDQLFVLATNHFRVAGGGGYAPPAPEDVIVKDASGLKGAMIDILRGSMPSPWSATVPWRFASMGGTRSVFFTHPDALTCLADIAHLRPALKGTTCDGFIRLSVAL
jgi:2',3'-cyclic-nucleotide 2'-phosphodiesterase/3'-nucleotidase